MQRRSVIKKRIFSFFSRFLGIADSPSRIARGVGLGLFLGVFPGTGAIAAVVCAFILRANKAAALAGALAVNTWINIVAFPAALVIGALCMRIDAAVLKKQWVELFGNFSWQALYSAVVIKSIVAVVIGYTVIGAALGLTGYAVTLVIVRRARRAKSTQQPLQG